MQRGKLRTKITIQSKTETANSYGEKIAGWSTFHQPWANIVSTPANESVKSDRATGTGSHAITIEYLSGLTADHRILYGSRVFQIHGVVNVDERNREMILNCSEVF